jgi:hypothetical protein
MKLSKMRKYLAEKFFLQEKLASAGKFVLKDAMVTALLNGLPESNERLIEVLENTPNANSDRVRISVLDVNSPQKRKSPRVYLLQL